jgi:hypothetical protein
MTNPTSNFGWQMPTPTDLVTDLPADFEVFGQAVDTSMADLKGGTTGQILSKATNTDMDFTWITNDVGDITAVTVTAPITGGGTSGSVGIGISAATTSASGAVQLSDSTSTTSSVLASTPTATKSAYDLAASAYAPAFTNNFYAGKNKVINGDFNINARAFTSTTVQAFGFDRWAYKPSGATGTYSAQTFTLGTAPVAGYEAKNFARLAVTVGNDGARLEQPIESVRTFANQTVTVSFWAKGTNPTTTGNLAVGLQQYFGTGGSPSASVSITQQTFVLTANWTRYSLTFAIPSISGKTVGTNNDDCLNVNIGQGSSLSTDSFTLDLWGVQVEAGSVATPFQTATGTIQGELAACQRYYYQPTTGAYWNGQVVTTTAYYVMVYLPVAMRAAPTITNTSIVAGNFPATASAASFAGLTSFANVRTANGTGAGGFADTYTASAEL